MKKYLNLKTASYVLLGYVALTYFSAQVGVIKGVDTAWYSQLFMKIIAGITLFVADSNKGAIYQVFSKVVTYFTGNKPAAPSVSDDVFDALDTVAETFSKMGDKEGVALCKTINSRLFDAAYAKKEEVANDTTTK